MYWALASMVMNSIGKVYLKQALKYNVFVELNDLIRQIPTFIVFLLYGIFYLSGIFQNTFLWSLTGITVVLYAFWRVTTNSILRKEKISALMPYSNVSSICTIIFSFFLFSDISLFSFIIAMVTMCVIIISAIDVRHLKISKNIMVFTLGHLFFSIGNIIMGYILINNSAIDYFIYYVILSTIFSYIICLVMGKIWQYKELSAAYYQNSILSGSLGWIAWFISLVVVKELGLSVSTLIWFLAIAVTLGLWYFILKDIPTKKDIILTIIVSGLVGLWFYFK